MRARPEGSLPAPREQSAEGSDAIMPADVQGLWTPVDERLTLDVKAANAGGLAAGDDTVAPFGTYVRQQYFAAHMASLQPPAETAAAASGHPGSHPPKTPPPVAYGVLDVFANDGSCGHFVWNGTDAWVSDPGPITFTAPPPAGGANATLERYSTLIVDKYADEAACPSGASPGDRYIRS